MSHVCRNCDKSISGYPCVFCGAKNAGLGAMFAGKADANQDLSGGQMAVTLLTLVLATGFFVWCGVSLDDTDAPPHDEVAAYVMCQDFAEDRLRAPSTADWPFSGDENATHLGGGRYRVRTYVDAQNAFGAMVRSDVDCTVRWVEDDRWRLEDLTIQ